MMNPKMLGLIVTAFVAESFVSSPELRAYASTIANNSVRRLGQIYHFEIDRFFIILTPKKAPPPKIAANTVGSK